MQVIQVAQAVVDQLDEQTTERLERAATAGQKHLRDVYGVGHQVRRFERHTGMGVESSAQERSGTSPPGVGALYSVE